VQATGWLKGLEVTADDTGVVSHAGLALLRALAERTGLTGGLSKALASDRLLVHDRGQVLADLACAIADGEWAYREPTSNYVAAEDLDLISGQRMGSGGSSWAWRRSEISRPRPISGFVNLILITDPVNQETCGRCGRRRPVSTAPQAAAATKRDAAIAVSGHEVVGRGMGPASQLLQDRVGPGMGGAHDQAQRDPCSSWPFHEVSLRWAGRLVKAAVILELTPGFQ